MKYETDGIQLGDKYYESTEALISGEGGSTGTPLKNINVDVNKAISDVPGYYYGFTLVDYPCLYEDGTVINGITDYNIPFSIKYNGQSYGSGTLMKRQTAFDYDRPATNNLEVIGLNAEITGGNGEMFNVFILKNSSSVLIHSHGTRVEEYNVDKDCILIIANVQGTIELEYVNKPSV